LTVDDAINERAAMQHGRSSHRRSPAHAIGPRAWLARLLVAAGAGALIWSGVRVAEMLIAQRAARSSFEAAALVDAPMPAFSEDGAPQARGIPPKMPLPAGAPIALISIPRVKLSAAVLHGSDDRTLRRGPGHVEGTAVPGEPGNVVIAGHRDSFFAPLRHIRLGDDIYLDTTRERIHYRVISLRIVEPRDISVLAPTDRPVLTLVTCYPFWVLGHAPDRFIVRAVRVGEEYAAGRIDPGTLPRVQAIAAPGPPVDNVRPPPAEPEDDESLVRRAVRRYLELQGTDVRPAADPPSRRARAVTCDVAVDGDNATAVCNPVQAPLHAAAPYARTVTLERTSGSWAIRSIVLR
jgi:sortase A